MESARSRLFTLDEYEAMGRAGILRHDERLELIRGVIVTIPPIGASHMWPVINGNMRFAVALVGRAIVSIQNPIRLTTADSEPQPDIVVISAEASRDRLPGPSDVLLVVEVADMSLRYDLDVKVPLYAECGIREVWVLDVERRRIHVFRDPRDGAYATTFIAEPNEGIAPLAFPDIETSAAELTS